MSIYKVWLQYKLWYYGKRVAEADFLQDQRESNYYGGRVVETKELLERDNKMTKIKELKATYKAAYVAHEAADVAYEAALAADVDVKATAAAAWVAYQEELKKSKEMTK